MLVNQGAHRQLSTERNERPSPIPWLDVIIILALVALNGVLSMSELAIVSSREARLKAMAKGGSSGAQCALQLSSNPGRFLSTVQIGITLVGILAGAYSGAALGGPVGERIALLGFEPETAETIGFAIVIVLTTFASVVIGEIVPKQFALRSPGVAVLVARPMRWLSTATGPIVWLLDQTSKLIFRLLGLNRESENTVLAEGFTWWLPKRRPPAFSRRASEPSSPELSALPIAQCAVTPRPEVDWIDVNSSLEELRAALEGLRTADPGR